MADNVGKVLHACLLYSQAARVRGLFVRQEVPEAPEGLICGRAGLRRPVSKGLKPAPENGIALSDRRALGVALYLRPRLRVHKSTMLELAIAFSVLEVIPAVLGSVSALLTTQGTTAQRPPRRLVSD